MRFNQVLVVDSIPEGEQNTARRLYQEVSDRAQIFAPAPAILYLRIESAADFIELLTHLARAVLEMGNYPILHIECHGGDDGFTFANGSRLTWAAMKPHFIELNKAMRLNLLVVVAACDGSAITYTVTPDDRAPLWGLIGPLRRVYPYELEGPLVEFYGTLLRTHSARASMQALHAALPDTYVFRSTQWIFQFVWDHYQATQETPEARLQRAAKLRNLMPANMERPSVQQIAEMFRIGNPDFFHGFRTTFFMCDLYPEHEERFQVVYERAMPDLDEAGEQ